MCCWSSDTSHSAEMKTCDRNEVEQKQSERGQGGRVWLTSEIFTLQAPSEYKMMRPSLGEQERCVFKE